MEGRADSLNEFAIIDSPSKGLANQEVMMALYQLSTDINGRANAVVVMALHEIVLPVQGRADKVVGLVIDEEPAKGFANEILVDSIFDRPANGLCNQSHIHVLYGLDEFSPDAPLYEPMSDYLFPTLPGLGWSVHKKPKFRTNISQHVSGREVRVSNYAHPIWEFTLTYEFLRAGSQQELQTLMGFFLARAGAFDTFLYRDPSEPNTMSNSLMGTGDGASFKYLVTKTYAGFTEPVGYVDPATLQIRVDGSLKTAGTDYTFNSPNQIEFVTPPALGKPITATGTWYYRVRFAEDSQDFENFMFNLWQLKKVTLVSVKP